MMDMFDYYLEKMLRDSMREKVDKAAESAKKASQDEGETEASEDKETILRRIKNNSEGLASTDEALSGMSYSVGLGHAHGSDRVILRVIPFNKIKTDGLQFNSIQAAALSLEENRNDWYKFLK